VGSSLRWYAVFPEWLAGSSLLRSGTSVDLVWPKNNSSAVSLLLSPSEFEISGSDGSHSDLCHDPKFAARAKLSHHTQLPRTVAPRNFEEWIA
jgi:hypothetical protein